MLDPYVWSIGDVIMAVSLVLYVEAAAIGRRKIAWNRVFRRFENDGVDVSTPRLKRLYTIGYSIQFNSIHY